MTGGGGQAVGGASGTQQLGANGDVFLDLNAPTQVLRRCRVRARLVRFRPATRSPLSCTAACVHVRVMRACMLQGGVRGPCPCVR